MRTNVNRITPPMLPTNLDIDRRPIPRTRNQSHPPITLYIAATHQLYVAILRNESVVATFATGSLSIAIPSIIAMCVFVRKQYLRTLHTHARNKLGTLLACAK
jgi:hypothetical protein